MVGTYEDITDLQARYRFHDVLQRVLNGNWEPAPERWEARRESMRSLFSKAQQFTFQPVLQVSPEASLIAPALSRPCDPKDKTVYSAMANAFSLLVARMAPDAPQVKELTVFDKFDARTNENYGPRRFTSLVVDAGIKNLEKPRKD